MTLAYPDNHAPVSPSQAVEYGREWLRVATTDQERLRVRDVAKAAQEASRILGMRDVQTMASLLVMDAERALAKANPSLQGRNQHSESIAFRERDALSPSVLGHIRQVHAKVDDDAYSALQAAARETETPLTREKLQRVAKASREVVAKERRAERESRPADDAVTLLVSDIASLHEHVPAASVDWIITDPPYAREHLHLWEELAAFAVHALKRGGSLLALSGQSWLPDVLARLNHPDLGYHWMLAYRTPQANTQIWGRHVASAWKPLLWYVKGTGYSDLTVYDVLTPPALAQQDTAYHPWGQQLAGVQLIVDAFAAPGDSVIDPFVGGGTTAVAARARGCSFLGADVDPAAIATTRERLV